MYDNIEYYNSLWAGQKINKTYLWKSFEIKREKNNSRYMFHTGIKYEFNDIIYL